MSFKTVIGIEIHSQIATKTKLFSRAENESNAEPNSLVEFVDAGIPGSLPVPNKKAFELALKACLALNMDINEISAFDRKHYFYPDLPLGYQISQFYKPIGVGGFLECSFGKVNFDRLHIETDAGKSMHEDATFVDLNRAGVPLMEIVTKPELTCAKDAVEFLKELRSVLLMVGASNCDMEQGNFRADINISLHKEGEPLGTRVEIKNLNSFRFIAKAIEFEQNRQAEVLNNSGTIIQETRLFDPKTGETKLLREKKDALDYMYFPDPDLLPIKTTADEVEETRKNLPKLPSQLRNEWEELGVLKEQGFVFSQHPTRAKFFNDLIEKVGKESAKRASNWVASELIGLLNESLESFIENRPDFLNEFADIISASESGDVSRPNAKEVLEQLVSKKISVKSYIEEKGYADKISNDLVLDLLKDVIEKSPKEVEKFRKGNEKILMFFVGSVMKQTKGKCDADFVLKSCKEILGS